MSHKKDRHPEKRLQKKNAKQQRKISQGQADNENGTALELATLSDEAFKRGEHLSSIGNYEEAIECYDKAIDFYNKLVKLDSNTIDAYDRIKCHSSVAHHSKGIALYRLVKYDKALKCFEEALNLNPTNGGAYNSIGLIL